MHRFRNLIVPVLVVLAAALVLAACGGSVSIGGSSSPTSAATTGSGTTYTSDKYGFSITHDPSLSEGKPVEGTGAGGSSVFDVIFADKSGAQVSGKYVDVVQVSVYELTRSIKATDVPQLKKELQGIVDQLMGSLTDAKVVQPLTPVTINGVPGFALKYTYTEGGEQLTAATFFLFKDNHEYQITAQATAADWDKIKGKLESAVQSFTSP